MRAVSLIEPLEDRIAPAGVSAVTITNHGKTATYIDANGDTVVVTTSKGAFTYNTGSTTTSPEFVFNTNEAGQLAELALTGHSGFTGANIVFTVFPASGGSASVNVGYIDALKLNLGSVTLPGDLGRIDVGGGATATALGKLTINSLDADGSSTQGGLTFSQVSNITGSIGSINIAGNLDGFVNVQDFNNRPGTGSIGKLNVGGSIDGNTGTGDGEIVFTGKLGTAVIAGGIEGGSDPFSGSISGVYGELASIGSITVMGTVPDNPNPIVLPSTVGVSILGGSGNLSGGISAASIGHALIAGDIFGGTGAASGNLQAGNNLGTVMLGGSLIGGNFASGSPSEANSAGTIFGGQVGSLTIAGSIYGGSGISSGEVLSTGTIQKIVVMGDVAGGSAGTSSATGLSGIIHGQLLKSVVIDGSLIGGNLVSGDTSQAGNLDGAILSNTSIGSIYIGKNLTGGSGPSSGEISVANGTLSSLTIGDGIAGDGSVIGGSGSGSGIVSVNGLLGKITLADNLTGGSGSGSGVISVNGGINSLVIGGGVTGGTADNTGTISAFGLLKSASIKNNITGSSSGVAKLTNTGYIQASGIGTMTVGGSLTAGTAGAGGLDTSGAIRSTVAIGSLTIGSLVGNSTNPAIVSAVGQANLTGTSTTDVAISTLKVTGNVSYADILAGYNTDTQNGATPLGTGVSADAQIGTVTIAGTLEATNIIAGVGPGANGFGTASSAALTGAGVSDLPSIISKISKVVVSGAVNSLGTATPTFGIAAQYIVSASISGAQQPLLPGADNDTFAAGKDLGFPASGGTADVFLYEV